MICAITIPGFVPGEITPIGHALQELQHFGNLMQRVPVIGYALLILLAAGGVGHLVFSFGVRGLDPALVARGLTRARHEKHSPQLGGFCSEASG